jgi:hypothetical protein
MMTCMFTCGHNRYDVIVRQATNAYSAALCSQWAGAVPAGQTWQTPLGQAVRQAVKDGSQLSRGDEEAIQTCSR